MKSNVKFEMVRGKVWTLEEMSRKSIAIDGSFSGPMIDLVNEKISFDHHANCIRHGMKATCQQVVDALLLGFDPNGWTVLENDVDGDTVLAHAALANPDLVKNEQFRQMVEVVGQVDAMGPAYVTANQRLVHDFYWKVMAPEVEAKEKGTYWAPTTNLVDMMTVIQDRLRLFLSGELHDFYIPDEESTLIKEGTGGWKIVEARGFAFPKLYREGTVKVVSFKRGLPNDTITYTVGKGSEFLSGFPVGPANVEGTILHALKTAEKAKNPDQEDAATWGGGSVIGGSPRNKDGSSSRLTPGEVFYIVESLIGGQK